MFIKKVTFIDVYCFISTIVNYKKVQIREKTLKNQKSHFYCLINAKF